MSLPPGPWGFPLLGHLHMLGDLPHRDLQKLSQKYGPIMHIRLGLVPAIVVSSPEWAELLLKTHDLNFASRPDIQASKCLSRGRQSMLFAAYGPNWRNVRKLCTLELLSNSKIESFQSMRREEVHNFIKSIKIAAESHSVINLTAKIGSLVEDMTFIMIFGAKDDKFNFKPIIDEATVLCGTFNLADLIPYMAALDLQGIGRKSKALSKVIDGFFERIIDEHVQYAKSIQGEHRDFIDVLLPLMETNDTSEQHLDRDTIKAILLDMLAAALDTSTSVTEWALSELLKHPRVMKLVQEELKNVVGMDRMVEEADMTKLDYLNIVIKESMRIHPVTPFLLPRESIEDITINGYFMPKKSRVLINTWAIGKDPKVWSSNAEEFYPERFIGTNIDHQGRDFQFLPFGSGRRKCPGMQLGITVVRLVLAQMVHCFNFELPDGMSAEDLDMSETFGVTLPRTNHLLAIPTYRLPMTDI
ncbi:hypothetical protein IFM89_017367 [Coptis chinensis]|uniref:Cytochrome P450 n=1 Tax=Coptis chinensis TaxID=261450 RepID=A0A835H6X2_9MAGN|nr:hypothetical protein IFM89_017367 [Coptis chinensis]